MKKILTATILSLAFTSQSTFTMKQTNEQTEKKESHVKIFGIEINPRKYAEEMAKEIQKTIENHIRKIEQERQQKQAKLNALNAEIEEMAKVQAKDQTPTILQLLNQKIEQAETLQEQIYIAEKDARELEKQCNQFFTKPFENSSYGDLGNFVTNELNKKQEQENLIKSTITNEREDCKKIIALLSKTPLEEDQRNTAEKENNALVTKLMDGAAIAQQNKATETIASIEEKK